MNFLLIAFAIPTVVIALTLDLTLANPVKRSVDQQSLADERCFSSKANISTQSTFQEVLSTLKSLTSYGRNKYTMTNTSFIFREVYDIISTDVWFQKPAKFLASSAENLSKTREESLRLALESLLFLIASTDYPDDNVRSIPGVINLLIKDRVYSQRILCSQVLGDLMNFVTSEGGLPRRLEAEYSAYFVLLTDFNNNLEYYHNKYGK